MTEPIVKVQGIKKTYISDKGDHIALAGVDFDVVPGEHTPEFRSRKYEVVAGNSGARLADPFGTLLQYAYNPDNRDEAKLGGYYLWRVAQDAPALTKLATCAPPE